MTKYLQSSDYDKADAWIAYYFRLNPDTLTDDEWCLKFAQVQYLSKQLNPDING
ncbi:MAG: hypothetical protein AAF587_29635 [Bacteroidota bacterium]